MLLLPNVSSAVTSAAFCAIDDLTRARKINEAMARADEVIYNALGIPDWPEKSAVLANALKAVRARRRPIRVTALNSN
jgi:hypothetical protein